MSTKAKDAGRTLTAREANTVLCALRVFQEKRKESSYALRDLFPGPGLPLPDEDIDSLCEEINCSEAIRIIQQ